MAIENQINKILRQFPRSSLIGGNGLFVKQFLDTWPEKLNIIGGKKVLTPEQRFYNEVNKRENLNPELVSKIQIADPEQLKLYLENLKGDDLAQVYPYFNYSERVEHNTQMFNILRHLHENNVIDGDAQLRNYVFTNRNGNATIKKTDLEAEWKYEKEGKILDILQLASDMYAHTKRSERDIDQIVYNLEDGYGPIQKMPIPKYMKTYFKTGWKIPQEFINHLEE